MTLVAVLYIAGHTVLLRTNTLNMCNSCAFRLLARVDCTIDDTAMCALRLGRRLYRDDRVLKASPTCSTAGTSLATATRPNDHLLVLFDQSRQHVGRVLWSLDALSPVTR